MNSRPQSEKLRATLNCASEAEFQEKRRTILDEMRQRNPAAFEVKPSMRAVLTMLAKQSGISFEEQLEETAIGAYLVEQSIPAADRQVLRDAVAEEKRKRDRDADPK